MHIEFYGFTKKFVCTARCRGLPRQCQRQGAAGGKRVLRGGLSICVYCDWHLEVNARVAALIAAQHIASHCDHTAIAAVVAIVFLNPLPLLPFPSFSTLLANSIPSPDDNDFAVRGRHFLGNFLIALSLICARTRLDNWKMHCVFACQAIDNRLGVEWRGWCGS